jgi:M-phase inducer tyrosine phosphatase
MPSCNPINGETLATHLKTSNHPIVIIDCRFDYEFNHGHIKGAININEHALLERTFFTLNDMEKLRQHMTSRTILVFHCEFSEVRAPSLWRMLREFDRKFNLHHWPKLCFPEMYLLEKGFSAFYKNFPELCVGGYKC